MDSAARGAHRLDRDVLVGDLSHGEVLEFAYITLHQKGAALALERLDPEQGRDGAGPGGAVERHVHALAGGDAADRLEQILLIDVDDVVGPELSCHSSRLFGIPLNAHHQHFNGSGSEPARYVATTNLPPIINAFEETEFIFNTPYDFKGRFSGEPDYFADQGEHGPPPAG